ncbi:NAD(P)/FAD-dependent oxidoreductase [Phenylobacterium terrae]|uniref:NADH:ubiquinone reductase (non-electrogenic) n=2 Tax=Phenylobacterium terrae TaxID=2665495 RepID=A0ABW4MX61_9CAUL
MASGARVIIVGGGFGGLEAARALSRAPAEVLLIDRQNHHCFQPLLYQVATAALSPADVAWPIRTLLRRQRNATVIMAEVVGVDPGRRQVRTSAGTHDYDFLVLATGATHSYFSHPEWAPAAPGLKRIEDATDIRRRILTAFERAEAVQDEAERRRLLTFVIVGAGPTGVELAGALAEVARDALPGDFRRIDPASARIVLVEAGPRVLPVFPDPLSDYARRALERAGVEVMLGARVVDVGPDGVRLEEGEIAAGAVLWAAGVVASPAAGWAGAEADRAGRAVVEPDLSAPGRPEVFVIGDTAAVSSEGGPVPGIAPAAKQMGRYVGRLIAARLAGRPAPPPFRYRHEGDLATIGRRAAVVSVHGLKLTGYTAWLFWSLAHIYFLIGLRNRIAVALNWAFNYVTYQRGARLITEPAAPPPPPG